MAGKTRNVIGAALGLIPIVVSAAIIVAAVVIFFARPARSADNGQWEATPPDIKQWFQTLMQPDNPRISCCGEADAYYADEVVTEYGKDYAIITDTRPDEPLGRPHVPPGTKVEIPPHKYKFDKGNPTGHRVIFLGHLAEDGLRPVFCFVDGGGV